MESSEFNYWSGIIFNVQNNFQSSAKIDNHMDIVLGEAESFESENNSDKEASIETK